MGAQSRKMSSFAMEVWMKGAEIAPGNKSRFLNYGKLRIALSRDDTLLSTLFNVSIIWIGFDDIRPDSFSMQQLWDVYPIPSHSEFILWWSRTTRPVL
jgi:hypothetical protein